MGSAANPTVWSPYDSYKDCSQGICSIYCPQWCYIIFPPPPPPFEAQNEGDSGTNFSPLIIAVIGILGSAFLLVSYYTIISKYCKRRTNSDHQNSSNELEVNQNQTSHDQLQQQQVVLSGLDESLIKSIAVCKYKRGDGLIEGTDCAVCLSEFQENENLRLLPKCSHAFHLPCIDTWLRSHSNCPLCRSNVVSTLNLLPVQTSSSSAAVLNVSNLEMRRQIDLVLVIDDDRDSRVVNQEQVLGHVMGDYEERTSSIINQENEHQEMRSASFSLGSFSCQGNLLIADILNISEDDELDLCEEICESQMGNSSVSTKRSDSRHDH